MKASLFKGKNYMIRSFVVLLLINMSIASFAQDIIVTNQGDRIECVIQAENESEVRFIQWNDRDKKERTLLKSTVWSITYDSDLGRNVKSATGMSERGKTYMSSPFAVHMQKRQKQSVNKFTNERRKHIVGGIMGITGYFVLGVGGATTGILIACSDNPWGYAVMGAGMIAGITSLCYGLKSFVNMPPKQVAIIDLPVNDKFSLGLYDYAFAQTDTRGVGLGMKISF